MAGLGIRELARRAKAASRVVALASTADKDAALHAAADLLVDRASDVLAANATNVTRAETEGAASTVVDRLRLTTARVETTRSFSAAMWGRCRARPFRWVWAPS